MIVTKIEKSGRYKYKVFLDEEYAFFLSFRELRFWKLEEGAVLTQEKYLSIMKESVLPKCKRKAISYLQLSNRTEQELRDKLRGQLYVSPIIDATIRYLYQLHYLDDQWYVEQFVSCHQGSKSKQWMYRKLSEKGIAREQAEQFIEAVNDQEALQRAIEKKIRGRKLSDRKEREKLMAYLFRQGFRMQEVLQVLKQYA